MSAAAANRLRTLQGQIANGSNKPAGNESRFRFTLDSTPLSESQRQFYEENGYIVFRNLVSHDLLNRCSQRFIDICEERVDRGRMSLVKDISLAKAGATGERLYNKVQDFMWDEVLYDYCQSSEIVNIVKTFTGPNVMAMHTMLINKPPDAGSETSRHPLHQDLHYFPFRPADRIACAWTAMERVTKENGCLVVLPGTHLGTLQPHDYPQWENGVNKMYHGIVGFDGHDRVHLEMEKGDTVFFHPILIHGSGANRTKGFRKAISCHYAASECGYIDVRGTSQENIAKEVEDISIKRGTPLNYIDLWRYRARLVTGLQLNL